MKLEKLFAKLFVHPFSKYLGMAYCVPGKFLSPGKYHAEQDLYCP